MLLTTSRLDIRYILVMSGTKLSAVLIDLNKIFMRILQVLTDKIISVYNKLILTRNAVWPHNTVSALQDGSAGELRALQSGHNSRKSE